MSKTSNAEAKQDFLRDAVESWRDYQATGLHLTGDEVLDWLASWDRQEEREVPQPHA